MCLRIRRLFFGGGVILIFEINLYWTWDCRTEWNMPLDRNRRYIPLYNQEMQIQYMCMLESFKHDGNWRNIFLSGGELICRPINKINQCFITGKWYVYARKYMNLYELKGIISFLSNFVWYKISYYFWTKYACSQYSKNKELPYYILCHLSNIIKYSWNF